MLYTVTITDDQSNQSLRGQSWEEVSDIFSCQLDEHYANPDMSCERCVLHCEVLDALGVTGSYSASGVEYSEYSGEYVNWTNGVTKEN